MCIFASYYTTQIKVKQVYHLSLIHTCLSNDFKIKPSLICLNYIVWTGHTCLIWSLNVFLVQFFFYNLFRLLVAIFNETHKLIYLWRKHYFVPHFFLCPSNEHCFFLLSFVVLMSTIQNVMSFKKRNRCCCSFF